ncbi:hypothetical protein ACFQS5_01930 [Salinirubellus sp. GCM10025899]|uniref:hypothetical protein n=1 Tax=Salinirubellus sp. GCM10025899 TaxID=3252689 RepID=UPI0036239741
MVPDPNDRSTGSGPGVTARETDGGSPPELDEAALYRVVRAAVEDALLDVLGTLLLVGVAFVLVVTGGQAVVASDSTAGTALGLVVAVGGVYLAAATLEVIPPVRDWL